MATKIRTIVGIASLPNDVTIAGGSKYFEPLIEEQIELGDLAADEAGMPYYRKAGGFMEQARPYVKTEGKETFEEFCVRASGGKSYRQCRRYIAAWNEQQAEVARLDRARQKGKTGRPRPLSNSLNTTPGAGAKGKTSPYREWTPAVDDLAARAREDQERRLTEQRKLQELARSLIDIGYKVLAKELHSDKGGSDEAMTRLNTVRNRLKQVYG